MSGSNFKIGKDEAPIISGERAEQIDTEILSAITTLRDLERLGHIKCHTEYSSKSDGDEMIRRGHIEIAYRVERT